jgi:hypothetical protein
VVVVAHQWQSTGEALVRDDRDRVEVDAVVELSDPAGLFRAHVEGRPHRHARAREVDRLTVFLLHLGDAEVEHLDVVEDTAAPREEDVVGLQVAVHDLTAVHRGERGEHLADDVHRAHQRQPALLLERLRERHPPQVLHHEVGGAVLGVAEVEHLDDVLVTGGRGGARLALEARDGLLVPRELGVQALERDLAPEQQVLRDVHRAHAPFSEDSRDLVAPGDDAPDQRRPSLEGLARERAVRVARGVRRGAVGTAGRVSPRDVARARELGRARTGALEGLGSLGVAERSVARCRGHGRAPMLASPSARAQ